MMIIPLFYHIHFFIQLEFLIIGFKIVVSNIVIWILFLGIIASVLIFFNTW